MALPTTTFAAADTIIPRKTFAAWETLQADGTTYSDAIELIGKMFNMDVQTEEVKREVPDASGYLRPDRIEVTKMTNIFKFELEDVKKAKDIFPGGLAGGMVTGRVQFWVVDPKDASTKCAIKSNAMKATVKLDGGLNLNAGEVSKVTLTFEALEAVTLTVDATA